MASLSQSEAVVCREVCSKSVKVFVGGQRESEELASRKSEELASQKSEELASWKSEELDEEVGWEYANHALMFDIVYVDIWRIDEI